MSLIDKYIVLMDDFSNSKVSASEFEERYLNMFKNEQESFPENIYRVLNDLFLNVDAYCSEANLRDEEDLDEKELMEKTKQALEQVIKIRGYK